MRTRKKVVKLKQMKKISSVNVMSMEYGEWKIVEY